MTPSISFFLLSSDITPLSIDIALISPVIAPIPLGITTKKRPNMLAWSVAVLFVIWIGGVMLSTSK